MTDSDYRWWDAFGYGFWTGAVIWSWGTALAIWLGNKWNRK